MSNRFVRASKYRHVFGRPTKKEQCYDNIRVSKNAWDTNLVKANPEYLSVNWDASGGGAFAVIPLNERGKLPEKLPLFRGHTAVVLDTDWNPFDDSVIASGSDDGKAFIWRVPDGFTLHVDTEDIEDVAPVGKLVGHSRKVGHVLFNPAAANVLATSSGDFTIKIWDVEAGSPRLNLKQDDLVQSLSWSADGSLLVTTSRDKKLRIWDIRQEQAVHVGPGHAGAKNSRAVWMGEHDRIATTGFSKMSDRQLGLWDIRNAGEPLGGFSLLDSLSGVCMPFWDDSTQCLYLAGKGDGNIRYFEYENDSFEYLSEYKSADPQRGLAFIPKRGLNIHENEVMRAFKSVNDSYIEPISFIVPRRSEVFQSDIYPPVTGSKPAMTANEWLDGKNGLPPKIDLESIYNGEAAMEITSEYRSKAPSISTALPAVPSSAPSSGASPRKQSTLARETTQPSQMHQNPAPSMKEQSISISTMASKFADEAQEASDHETSSFEEVTKPIEKHIKPVTREELGNDATLVAAPEERESAPEPLRLTGRNNSQTLWNRPGIDGPIVPDTPGTAGGSMQLQSYMAEIKSLLQQQRTTMAAQSEMIVQLTSEMDTLKRKIGEDKGKEERITELEKELAALRS